jgi:hypothetical protein
MSARLSLIESPPPLPSIERPPAIIMRGTVFGHAGHAAAICWKLLPSVAKILARK